MAFISMIFAGVALIVLLIGLFFTGIALILDIVCIVLKCLKKKIHVAIIVFTVIFNVAGFVLFVLPVSAVAIIGAVGQLEDGIRFKSAKNKVYISADDKWRDGFEYNGIELIGADYLVAPKKSLLSEEGVLIEESGSKYYINSVKNDGDFAIYAIEKINDGVFCDKEQYDEIYEYYHSAENLSSSIDLFIDGERTNLGDDFDPEMVLNIRALYNHHRDGVCYGENEDIVNNYYITSKSSDGLFYESVNLFEYENRYVLAWTSGGGSFSALYLPEEYEAYVREKLEH